jgi:hypothetical protein
MRAEIRDIMLHCMFQDDEIGADRKAPEGAVIAEGIVQTYGFHPERLKSRSSEVGQLLLRLPTTFFKSQGGGWSFLNACNTNEGEQWTAYHRDMEELICLGIGLDFCSFATKRETWNAFPGGMPYVIIDDLKIKLEITEMSEGPLN